MASLSSPELSAVTLLTVWTQPIDGIDAAPAERENRPAAIQKGAVMHGPPHTPAEIAALLNRGVERLKALGVPHDRAVEAIAAQHGVAAERVAHLLDAYGFASRDEAPVLA